MVMVEEQEMVEGQDLEVGERKDLEDQEDQLEELGE